MSQEISKTRKRRPSGELSRWTAAALLILSQTALIPGLSGNARAQPSLPTTPITLVDCFPYDIYLPVIYNSNSSVTAAEQNESTPNIKPAKPLTSTVPVISSTMVISVNTGAFGLHDPSGLTPLKNETWMITDGEVEEPPSNDQENVALLSQIGELIEKKSTTGFSNEPTGATEDKSPNSNKLFFSDDDRDGIWEADILPSGEITSTKKIRTPQRNSDSEGVAMDTSGNLVIAGGGKNRILLHQPGAGGVFTGICTKGGDDITHEIKTDELGLLDPEGVYTYTAPDGKEYYYTIATGDNKKIYVIDINKVNMQATLTEFIDMSQTKASRPADVAVLPNGDVGVVFRGKDNSNPNNNDGQMNVVHPNRQQQEAALPSPREVAYRNPHMNLRAKGTVYRRGPRRT